MPKENPPSTFAQDAMRNAGSAIPRGSVSPAGQPMFRTGIIDPTVPRRTDGPLGMKNVSPGAMAQFKQLHELMALRDAEVPQEMRSTTQEPVPQIPDSPIPVAEAEQEMPEMHDSQEDPEGPETQPVSRQAFTQEELPGVHREGPFTPMEIIATSGSESRTYNVLGDQEYFDTVMWKASAERRKYFDANRCKPIVWDNMLLTFEVTQEVLVWTKPANLWVDFRTMTADDEYLARKILEKEYGWEGPAAHVGNVLTTVAAGCNTVGNLKLPSLPAAGHTKESVRYSAMKARISVLSRLPHPLLADIAINYTWFVMRVGREMRDGETLKNG